MVTDIHVVLQKHDEDGHWITIDVPGFFQSSGYGLFAWLVCVRNGSAITPLSEPRGLPDDFAETDWIGDHDFSWFRLDELLSVDFDRIVEDRRYTGIDPDTGFRDSGLTTPPGEGTFCTLRDFLKPPTMDDLAKAKALGVERIVFGFDS